MSEIVSLDRVTSPPVGSWRKALARAIRDPDALCDRLGLDADTREAARRASARFPLLVTESYLSRIRPGDPDDPLLLQILPRNEEEVPASGFVADPVGDLASRPVEGLLHKYQSRALFVTTGVCAIHCRYCFRRHFPYDETPRGIERWTPALDYLASDPEIDEVILSGGDPLTLTDDWLGRLVDRISAIPHVRRLRIHTRLPIVLPERVDEALLGLLTGGRLTPIMVVHANHANEIDTDCAAALRRLVRAGVPTLNQAVLLRGVNDSAAALETLCRRLVDLGVMPYYLHQLDRVDGAAHFEVPVRDGLAMVEELGARLPGYALPRYVREIPGAPGKLPILGQ